MRTSWPKISIITPSYNQGQYIEQTIQSVLGQKYPNLEYIVMDGGSTDQTVRILKKYSKQLTWVSEPDHGQTDAINKGLRLSTGDIVAYLNSDDSYEPHALKTIALYLRSHPRTQFVYGKGQLIDAKGKPIGFYNDSQATTESLHGGCVISQPTAFWTKNVATQIGEFDESFHFTMDYDFWVRVSKKFKMVYLPDVLANTRIHNATKTSSQTHKLHKEAIRVQKTHYHYVHHDWIFTFVDGLVHARKDGTFFEEIYYWVYLFTTSMFLQIWWNHRFPSHPMRKQYVLWCKEIKQRLLKRITQ